MIPCNRKLAVSVLVGLSLVTGLEAYAATVNLFQTAFSPTPVTINAGDTVTFHDVDGFPQILQTSGTSDQFRGPLLLQGQNFSHTFQTPGVDFYQNLAFNGPNGANLGPTGAIVVRPATGPATIDVNLTLNTVDLSPLTIVAGDTVVWHNNKFVNVLQSTTGSADTFLSKPIFPGSPFAFTFNNPGTVHYRDLVNGLVAGEIDVVPASSPVPLPGAVLLFGSGLSGLAALERIRRARQS